MPLIIPVGHRGDLLDWRFLADPVKTLDHRDRGAAIAAALDELTPLSASEIRAQRRARFLAMPSRFEASPLVAVEARAEPLPDLAAERLLRIAERCRGARVARDRPVGDWSDGDLQRLTELTTRLAACFALEEVPC